MHLQLTVASAGNVRICLVAVDWWMVALAPRVHSPFSYPSFILEHALPSRATCTGASEGKARFVLCYSRAFLLFFRFLLPSFSLFFTTWSTVNCWAVSSITLVAHSFFLHILQIPLSHLVTASLFQPDLSSHLFLVVLGLQTRLAPVFRTCLFHEVPCPVRSVPILVIIS